ncbi:MAG: hypothetical protein P1U80_00790 [Pseudomonadales bacterium]|nr:hypothetical protein [Pseudomonadales bacterium]
MESPRFSKQKSGIKIPALIQVGVERFELCGPDIDELDCKLE